MHVDLREADEHVLSFVSSHPLRDMGELRLLEAAFGDGLAIVLRLSTIYRPARVWRALTRSERRGILTTCRWLMHDDETRLFSFIGAADALDIDAHTIRAKVLSRLKKTPTEFHAWIHEEAKRIRHEDCK